MPTNKKTIQSYDAFAPRWTKLMRSGENVAHRFLEKPAMYKKLPNLKGKSVLCLGCGSGEECGYIKSKGAKKVVGIDVTPGLIDIAKNTYPDLEFHVMDMEKLKFPKGTFDFAYSSLVLHYIPDWKKTLKNIHAVLKKNGRFLFSTHHPFIGAAESHLFPDGRSMTLGYSAHQSGCEIQGDYFKARRIDDVWFDELRVTYYHRPLADILKDIHAAGFEIVDFLEPKALKSAKKINPQFQKVHEKLPLFMIFESKKSQAVK